MNAPTTNTFSYEFLHDGNCYGGWISPSTSQSSLQACADDCGIREGVGYFAWDGNSCSCYTADGGCPDTPTTTTATTTATTTTTITATTTVTVSECTTTTKNNKSGREKRAK